MLQQLICDNFNMCQHQSAYVPMLPIGITILRITSRDTGPSQVTTQWLLVRSTRPLHTHIHAHTRARKGRLSTMTYLDRTWPFYIMHRIAPNVHMQMHAHRFRMLKGLRILSKVVDTINYKTAQATYRIRPN